LATTHTRRRPFSILMVDLDHFKSINDRFGHQVGDAAILAAVEAMQDSIRGSDILARWGGEEFTALLPNADCEAAHIVAERLRANVERVELPVEVNGPNGRTIVTMTVSIGLATCETTDDIHTVMGRADQNLYLAKDSGRNRVLSDSTPERQITVAAS
jgi:diguanylate cyclase (GGDEF)-like protein